MHELLLALRAGALDIHQLAADLATTPIALDGALRAARTILDMPGPQRVTRSVSNLRQISFGARRSVAVVRIQPGPGC